MRGYKCQNGKKIFKLATDGLIPQVKRECDNLNKEREEKKKKVPLKIWTKVMEKKKKLRL